MSGTSGIAYLRSARQTATRLACLAAALVVGSIVGIARAQTATQPSSPAGQERNWELTSYLKGTAPEVRDLLNGELERLINRKRAAIGAIGQAKKDIKAQEQEALEKLRKDPEYMGLREEMDKAEAELNLARKSGTAQDRIDASSRFNKVRSQVEKRDREAMAGGPALAALRKSLVDQQEGLKRNDDSIEKAQKWRSELLNAMRNAFRLMWPLVPGRAGMLGTVTPLEIKGKDTIQIEFEAYEELRRDSGAEGVKTVNVRTHKVTMLVTGVDTSAMRVGVPITLDQTFMVTGGRADAGETVQVKRAVSDADHLFEVVVPLRVEPEPAVAGADAGTGDGAAAAAPVGPPKKAKPKAWRDVTAILAAVPADRKPKKGEPWSDVVQVRMNDWLAAEVAGDTLESAIAFTAFGAVKDEAFDLRGHIEIPANVGAGGVKQHSVVARCPASLAAKAAKLKAGQKVRISGTVAAIHVMPDGTTTVELVEASF